MLNNLDFRKELYQFGVSVHLIEPGAVATQFSNVDNWRKTMEVGWSRLSPDVKAEYGENYLDECKQYLYLHSSGNYLSLCQLFRKMCN